MPEDGSHRRHFCRQLWGCTRLGFLAQPCPSPATCQGLIQEGFSFPESPSAPQEWVQPQISSLRSAAESLWVCWKWRWGSGRQRGQSLWDPGCPFTTHLINTAETAHQECLLRGEDADSSWMDDPEGSEFLWCL